VVTVAAVCVVVLVVLVVLDVVVGDELELLPHPAIARATMGSAIRLLVRMVYLP
jgi:hypothetical protein